MFLFDFVAAPMRVATVFFVFGISVLIPTESYCQVSKASAQTQEEEKRNEELREKWSSALGTFQFHIIDSRINPQVNIAIIEEIEKKRHQTEVVYIDYRENIKIMILPRSAGKDEALKKELFKYISTK